MADTDLAIRYRNHPRVERLIETLRDGLEEVSLAYNRSDTPGRPAPGAYLALDVSARSDVIATLTLSQESGRVTASSTASSGPNSINRGGRRMAERGVEPGRPPGACCSFIVRPGE